MWLSRFFFIAILIVGAVFRFTGVNWDSNQHLHPDERFLTMVTNEIEWPRSIGEYFNTAASPLNPHNKGFDFFVYGTFPIFLVKFVAEAFGRGDYVNLTLVGRAMSALTDMGTMMLVYLIAKKLIFSFNYELRTTPLRPAEPSFAGRANYEPLWAMFAYSIMTLPIQLSHFFTTDPYLTFFLTLTLYLILRLIVNSNVIAIPLSGRSNLKLMSLRAMSEAILLSIRLPRRPAAAGIAMTLLTGFSFGLAIASKISAVYFLPVIALSFIFRLVKLRQIGPIIVKGILFLLVTLITVKLAQPYLFMGLWSLELNSKVTANWQQLRSFDSPDAGFPPAIQWVTTIPYLHPLMQGFFWGVGPVMGILIVIGVIAYLMSFVMSLRGVIPLSGRTTWQSIKSGEIATPQYTSRLAMTFVLLWIIIPFLIQGGQYVKTMRYFSPLYPMLAIFTGLGITNIIRLSFSILRAPRSLGVVGIFAFFILLLIWPTSFFTIYMRPHTRVTASEWIYENIPEGAILSSDHWDDGLPLCLSADKCRQYVHEELHLFDPDTPEKWERINEQLARVDYLIITSNRTYGALGTVPEKFPLTTNFYRRLFAGELNFLKVADFTSRPTLPFPWPFCLDNPLFSYGRLREQNNNATMQQCNNGISVVDDFAEETWTVYDHPKVMIFKRTNK